MSERPETGAMLFGDDWSGVFLRGDDAIPYAIALKNLLQRTSRVLTASEPTEVDADVFDRMNLQALVELLLSCEHPPPTFRQSEEFNPQRMKAFAECLSK